MPARITSPRQALRARPLLRLPLIGVSMALMGCGEDADPVSPSPGPAVAVAAMEPANDSGMTGTVTFTQRGDAIEFLIEVENVAPGEHAVHIHEKGDCSAADGTSAGGHWNPTDVAHGKWGEGEFHLGDIGNMTVGDDGKGALGLTTDLWELDTGSDRDVLGKAMIVHEGADDFTSQPSGAAGARIGCGVIALHTGGS